MSKRRATTELNHDNWNLEDEPDEDPGVFAKASKEDMNKREIRTAVRRLPKSQVENGGKSVFSNFSGFGVPNKPDKPIANLFANIGAPLPNKSPKDSEKVENKNQPIEKQFSFKNGTDVGTKEIKKDDKQGVYLSKLKGLNESLIDWIKSHFEKNPTCILTPIFADYEKYLKEIKAEKDTVESNPINSKETTSSFSFSKLPAQKENKLNSTTISPPKKDEEKTPTEEKKAPTFSFGTSSPSFGSSTPNFGMATPFGKSITPFTFSPSIPANKDTTSKTENAEEEEGAGEKYDFVPVVENEALFSQRVKVFVKKDNNYVDKGVGTLYIKNVDDKYQAVVRADTNLGNVLMNIVLNKDIPSDRVGKNNVTLLCIPTPEFKPPPIPVLLRVKTGEEADKLLEAINKYKNMDKNESSD